MIDLLENVGYHADSRTELAISALMSQRGGGARVLLIEGAPGTGKTALAEAVARAMGAPFIYTLLHPWSGSDDLFVGVNILTALTGNANKSVHQDGVLALAAHASQQNELIVVCLDELDKAPELIDTLLLDWLQSGCVPVKPGVHLQTRLDKVLVFLISNGQRPLSDALLRRCRRLRMAPMADDLRVRLAAERSGAPVSVCRIIDSACRAVAEAEGNTALSLQEISHACREAWELAGGVGDLVEIISAWAARTPDGVTAVSAQEVHQFIVSAWNEIIVSRKKVK